MRLVWTAVLAPLLLTSIALAGSTYAPATLEYYFRLEWQVTQSAKGPVLEGYVYKSAMTADRMLLRIDELDAAGKVVASKTTWVLGGVPPNNRAWYARAPGREVSRGDRRLRLGRARGHRQLIGCL
jgi:hypothetical protein